MADMYPKEYTPELRQSFYESLARPVREQEALNVGRARSEALSRGLEGDPFEAASVGAARTAATNALSDLWSGISMQGAGMARQERLTGEARQYETAETEKARAYQTSENEKLRAFQAQMAELDRANQRRIARGSRGGLGDIAGLAAGYFTGGLGAGLAKKIVGG